MNISLTLQSREFLEKLSVNQLVKKFAVFYGAPSFIAVFKNSHH
jgi:hypothetical protein